MIKYLRDKITGRPAVFSPADDLSLDDNIPSIKKTHSQNSLNDVMSISINSNLNDITSSDQTISQVEKLTAASGGHRLICSSSPIIIPKKPTRSNASPQSSSSYTSVADQMSLLGETSLQTHREFDDVYTSLPMLPSTSQQLEHSAARDRILVKNKRRQPIKGKLSTLRETDDNQNDLFSLTIDDEQVIESKVQQQQQPVVNISDLDTVRTHLRVSVRPRDHSADNILSTKPIVPTYISSIQRSISCKRPQELNETKQINRSIFKIEKDDEEENKIESKSYSISSKEHIYDNLDLFKRHKINIKSDTISNENDSSINNIVKSREHSVPINTRLRPVTMHIPTNNDKQTINEFENVFNQLKKRASIKKVQSKEENILGSEEPVQSPVVSVPIEDTPTNLLTENVPIIPIAAIPTNKIVEIPSVSKSPNRRRTVGGVNLIGNNKVAVDDNKPTPSWIDIAKQKQSKFQSVSIEKNPQEEAEQQTPSIEPVVVPKKQVLISSNVAIIKENTPDDNRSNRKSMFEPLITRRASPPIAPTNTHVMERDSIRALKAGNPNRINNLIQFFDK